MCPPILTWPVMTAGLEATLVSVDHNKDPNPDATFGCGVGQGICGVAESEPTEISRKQCFYYVYIFR